MVSGMTSPRSPELRQSCIQSLLGFRTVLMNRAPGALRLKDIKTSHEVYQVIKSQAEL